MRRMWLMTGLLLLAGHAPARAEWREAESDHFRIFADTDEAGLRTLAEKLERFDGALRALRRVPREGSNFNKLVIYALPDMRAVEALAGTSGIGGWYDPRTEGATAIMPLTVGRNMFVVKDYTESVVLLHEYTHHFFFRNTPGVYPAWYAEGYAEFFSTAEAEPDGSVVIGLAATHRAADFAHERVRVQELLGGSRPSSVSGNYAKGWLLTHYLTFSAERSGQLAAYLTALNRGVPSPKAARDAFGDLPTLEAEAMRYLRQTQLPSVRIAAARIVTGPVRLRVLTPGEQRMMPVTLQLHRLDPRPSRGLAERARRDAAGLEGDAAAQTVLARAELAAGETERAEAAAERALKADPRDPAALFVRAQVAIARAGAATPAARAAAWTEARGRIVLANRAAPDTPGPLAAYYASFAAAGQAPTPAAVAGLHRAALLAPEAPGLSLLLAGQAIAERDWPAARAALAPLAFAPHPGKSGEAAAGIVALIDQGKTDGLAAAAAAAFAGKNPETER